MLGRLTVDLKEMVLELQEFHELLRQMTLRDLRLRYKQTLMGVGWAIFMPLVNTAVFSVIFTRVAPLDTGLPYPLYAYCGLLMWNFSASSFRFAISSLTGNLNLVTKVYFPREVCPISAVLVSLADLLVGSLVLVGLMVYYRVGVTWTVFALPIVLLFHVGFTLALALFLSMANLFYRDVKYLFEVAIVIWMFATSVLYPISLAGGRVARVLALNPMTGIIDAYRDVLLLGKLPDPIVFTWTATLSCALLFLSWLAFHRAEFRFAENI